MSFGILEEDDEMLTEVLEGYDDEQWEESDFDESVESEEFEERRRAPRYRRQRKSVVPSVRPARPVGGASGARISTPAGEANVRFPKALATKESVDARVKELKQDIARNTAAIKKVESTLDKNTAVLDKKINAVGSDLKKSMQQMQQMMILPMLMKPELEKITFTGAPGIGENTVEKASYKDGTTLLLPLMMMGGFGGTGTDSSSMMIMALALSGALGK